jgi:hypothetical protein
VRRQRKTTSITVHDWTVEYKVRDGPRAQAAATNVHGDIKVIDPRDGQRLLSLARVRSKLGVSDDFGTISGKGGGRGQERRRSQGRGRGRGNRDGFESNVTSSDGVPPAVQVEHQVVYMTTAHIPSEPLSRSQVDSPQAAIAPGTEAYQHAAPQASADASVGSTGPAAPVARIDQIGYAASMGSAAVSHASTGALAATCVAAPIDAEASCVASAVPSDAGPTGLGTGGAPPTK